METHQKIDEILQDCSEKGWDTYKANPVHPLSAKLAHAVADAVTVFMPEGQRHNVFPENEGGYEWEWDADGGTYFVHVLFLPDEVSDTAK